MKYLILLLLVVPSVSAFNVSIEPILKEGVVGVGYDKLFLLTNLEHVPGETSEVFVEVVYNVSLGNETVVNGSFSKTINSYSSTNTGEVNFEKAGEYLLCGFVVNGSYACGNVSVIDTSGNYCNVSVSLKTEKTLYEDGEKIGFWNELSSEEFPFVVEYWVEDSFGRVVKKPVNTSNLNPKSFTPNIDSEEKVLVFRNKLVELACNNTNKDLESFVVIGVKKYIEYIQDSDIIIKKVYTYSDNAFRFGADEKVRLEIYKGNTSKKTVSLWVEGVSEKTTVNLDEKFRSYELVLPVSLKPNCDEKLEEKQYKVVAEGLDADDEEYVLVEGWEKGVCKETEKIVEKEIPVEVVKEVVVEKEVPVVVEKEVPKATGVVVESSDEPGWKYAWPLPLILGGLYFFRKKVLGS